MMMNSTFLLKKKKHLKAFWLGMYAMNGTVRGLKLWHVMLEMNIIMTLHRFSFIISISKFDIEQSEYPHRPCESMEC